MNSLGGSRGPEGSEIAMTSEGWRVTAGLSLVSGPMVFAQTADFDL